MLPEPADGAIHRGDLGIAFPEHFTLRPRDRFAGFVRRKANLAAVVFRGQVVVESKVGGESAVWFVRRAEPDDRQEWLVAPACTINELESLPSPGFLNSRP